MKKATIALMLSWIIAMLVLAGCGTFKGAMTDTSWFLRSVADNITIEDGK